VGVVTYMAVIDVDNVDRAVPPGGTALVMLAGGQRENAVRIPNAALAFHPSPAAFAAADQQPPVLEPAGSPRGRSQDDGTRDRYVWKFESGEFVPVRVETGFADDSWTELVSGPVQPGDALVTSAVPAGR
jgi:HlyD family secretion protein